jgi:diaminopimelate decarboxylase
VGGARLRALAAEHGPAFFIYHPDRLKRNYRRLLASFREHYPNTHVAYSVKTNYLPRLCRDLYDWGAGIEVVSPMELTLARKLGVDGRRVVVNGPYKTEAFIEEALLAKAMVNLDDFYELETVQRLRARYPRRSFRLGLRVDFRIPTEHESRFGFSYDTGDVEKVLQLAARQPGLRFSGIHAHYCFQNKKAKSYELLAEKMAALFRRLRDAGHPIEEINMGGGFYSEMPPDLASQFPEPLPTFADYGRAIARRIARGVGKERPKVILEPGLAIVADALTFVTSVINVKDRESRRLAFVAGSVYDVKPTKSRVNLPVRVHPARPRRTKSAEERPYDIVGQTCMEDDVLYRGLIGDVRAGDLLEFANVGAYSLVLKPAFIYSDFPVITAEGTELRRAQSFEGVFSHYRLGS